MPSPSIAVVVPAFNERRHIEHVLSTIPSYVDTVICVDDASSDETAELAGRVPGVDVVRHLENKGVGAALATGYQHALGKGADIIAVMAGDGQMKPEELWDLLVPIIDGQLDYVKGNRLSHPEVDRHMPTTRRWGTRTLSLLTRLVAGPAALPPIQDAQCGFTAISATALRQVPLERLYPRYGYPNDLLVMLAARGARVGERTVSPVYADEASGLRPALAVFTHSFVLARAGLWRVSESLSGNTRRRG